ncbi:subtilisin inhibitor [Nannochloropsis gaditana]|uniref:Subtilisin inhibitor n=1 Tax=Nannochloropsis gaditana TaxID=72520 RepID=W7T4E6_9STRA|nr:subtilisin inhibitor [Nannochloropsis gaditana]
MPYSHFRLYRVLGLLLLCSVACADFPFPSSQGPSSSSSVPATSGSGGVPSESMTDKDNKGGGGAFDPKDLAFKMPTQSKDEIFSDKPPKSWPELVGMDGEDAKKQITADMPGLNVIVLPKNSPCTMDYRLERVRVFVDEEGKVVVAPSQG